MDEKDGAYSNTNYFNNSPINSIGNLNRATDESTFGSFENNNSCKFNQDDLDSSDTIDSMHKDFLSKLNLRYLF